MTEPATCPARPWSRLAAGGSVLCLLCWVVVAIAGPSAAVPALGDGFGSLDLDLRPPSGLVTVLLALSVSAGGVGLVAAVRAVSCGWRPRALLVPAAVAGVVLTFVPPVGSADHLSYAAYGRIAVLGGDPYTQPPDTFAGGADPVASAVRDPWRSTTSVYGPVATLLQALTSQLGGDSVRTTVWWWQVLLLLVWAGAAVGIRAAVRDPAHRARAEVLWTANPLLLTVGLGGAHADVLAGAAAVGALLLARRYPALAGVALAVAVGTKLPYGAVAAGVVVAAVATGRSSAGWLLRGAAGTLVVLVPAHLWAGAHVYDQTRTASRYVSLATIWRPLVEAGLPRGALLPGMLVVMAVVAVLWWPLLVRGDFLTRAAGVTTVLGVGYLVGTAYELPWYDLLLWGPLALTVPGVAAVRSLTAVVSARLTLLALAYVPGLVDGMSPLVETVTLGYRREVGPWISWAAFSAIIALAVVERRRVVV